MSVTFRIPKLTDRQILTALRVVRDNMKTSRSYTIAVSIPHSELIKMSDANPEDSPALAYILDLHSRVIVSFHFYDDLSNRVVVTVQRRPPDVYDEASIIDDWMDSIPHQDRNRVVPPIYVKLQSLLQKELRCDELTAAFSGTEDNAWNRFRQAQTEVLNSLQQTSQHLLIDSAKQIEAVRDVELKKNEDLRAALHDEFEKEREKLAADHAHRLKDLEAREEDLKGKLVHYETHETLYVSRQKTDEQMKQLKDWLKDSSLTPATVQKRRPVFLCYLGAIFVSLALTVLFSWQTFDLLRSTGANLTQLPWWMWLSLSLKVFAPLAALTTLAFYFIRWEGAWARQHAEEELRTRARVIDIGRSAWLLESVRDAEGAFRPT